MLSTVQTFNVVVQYIVKMQKSDILKLQCVKLSVDCIILATCYRKNVF